MNKLPSAMTQKLHCKKLKLTCAELKHHCEKKLGRVLGKSKHAKKCKRALREDGNKPVKDFCELNCQLSGKTPDHILYMYNQ